MMRIKNIALALFACLALGAFAANAAQAEGTGWTIEESAGTSKLIPAKTHQEVKCVKHSGSTLTFESSVTGIPVALKANAIDCLKEAGSTAKATIDNTTSPNHSEGVLTFTEVTVEEPKTCTVPGTLTTAALTDTVIMDPTNKTSGPTYDKFFPETEGGAFVTITFGGAECPFNGAKASVKGTACGESVHTTGIEKEPWAPNSTGTLTSVQTLLFGAAQQSTGGCALTLGTAAATLKGAVDNELVGTFAGRPFGSD